MADKKSYGIKVNTVISSVEYLMSIRTYAESILISYDEDSEFYSKDLLRELCAFIAAVTAQVDWVLEDIVPRQPEKGYSAVPTMNNENMISVVLESVTRCIASRRFTVVVLNLTIRL